MDKINQLHREWLSLQPFKPEYQQRLDEKFMLEFNYNSNHIEGNTLTYSQTKVLFKFGITSGNASLKDYNEMKAHNVGLELMRREAADRERPLTETFIRTLNKTIMVDDFRVYKQMPDGTPFHYEVHVGVYKTRPNSVITHTGDMFYYASPEETPALMTDLIIWYNDEEKKGEMHPIELASLLHYRYIRIHPFEDGNGRVARLLVNYVLARHGWPMLVVKTADRDNYIHALDQCNEPAGRRPSDGAKATLQQITPFLRYMEEQERQALHLGIKAAHGEDIEEDDDFKKRMALFERNTEEQVGSGIKFDRRQLCNVLDKVYFPLEDSIISAIQPAHKLLDTMEHQNLLSADGDKLVNPASIDADYKLADPGLINDIFDNAKAIFFFCKLSSSGKHPKWANVEIELAFKIVFEEDFYTVSYLDDKQFSYGTYPSYDEIDKILRNCKNTVLETMEKAVYR